uniref:Uncharacterized protein n=1 Tax=viral metagenome TaxID=1070528 RepID=A0A6C0BNS8_9ZZZZ
MQFLWNTLRNSAAAAQGWTRPDIMKPFYSELDWDRTVIGGSYALSLFTEDDSWTPNDVDILIAASSVEDFHARVEAFVNRESQGQCRRLEKFSDFSKGHPHDDPEAAKRDEKFHEAIRASAKVSIDGVEQVLQFVYIEAIPPTVTQLRKVLDQITDVPACVNYQAAEGDIQFNVPQKGVEALCTRQVNASDICPSRRAKYSERGYTFLQ